MHDERLGPSRGEMSWPGDPEFRGRFPKLGDIVTASIVGEENEWLQGLFVKDNGDGTIEMRTPTRTYTCKLEGASVVPEDRLYGTLRELREQFNK